MSVLWLTGAPHVGKSTFGSALYSWAVAESRPIAYVDIDILDVVGPQSSIDAECRRNLKIANLYSVLETFHHAGADQVVVSGVVDPVDGIASYVDSRIDVEFTLIRLRCSVEELRNRYLGCGFSERRISELVSFAADLDHNDIGLPLDTTTMSSVDVVDVLADHISPPGAPRSGTVTSAHEVPLSEDKSAVLLISSTTAAGKSTVGCEVVRLLWEQGIPAAYVDVDQLGFCRSGPTLAIKAENLSRIRHNCRRKGVRALVEIGRASCRERV